MEGKRGVVAFSSGEGTVDWVRIQRLVKGRALPLDNSVALQAVFQVTCCTISGGCQSWSIRLSDAFNTQYYSTFFLLFPALRLFFACVSVLVNVCVCIYLRQSVRVSKLCVCVCCAREPTFLSDPSPIFALSCLSVAH